ncbi:MAG: tetratricopeptide repeat protein [Gammaproteobacteria bacterium]|nr:tetratricopeptide repeat protein [Gammaproteobacteria bacterium]
MAATRKPLSPKKQQKIDGIMRRAVAAHQAGDLTTAERSYRKVLKEVPHLAEALHLLGLARFQQGDAESGAQLIERAVAIDNRNPLFYYNLGNVQKSCGQLLAAKKAQQQALALQPRYAEAAANLGGIHQALGEYDEAIAQYQNAIVLNPRDVFTHNNLGTLYRQRNNNEQAERCYRAAFDLNPGYAEPLANLGVLLRGQGRQQEAAQYCRRAVELSPDNPELWTHLGTTLVKGWQLREGSECYQRALELDPQNSTALSAMGNALRESGDIDRSLERLRRSVKTAAFDGKIWDCLLFTLNYNLSISRQQSLELSRQFGEALQTERARHGVQPCQHPHRDPEKAQLRIGFVSADFRTHSCAYFLLPLFEHIDRDRFELFCYSGTEHPDEVTARFQELSDHWHDTLGRTDRALADTISADSIDILVDLSGHTNGNRLTMMGLKPAPVQATWLGYPNTSGLLNMDYRITDDTADPHGSEAFHTEKLQQLDNGFLCFQPLTPMPDVAPLPAPQAGHITFGCMNNFSKVTGEVLDLWAKLLCELPGSRLLLKAKQLADVDVHAGVLRHFQTQGIEAQRLTLLAQLPSRADHFAQYHHIDIALDPFPYNGTTTTCEALWMGVPVVSLCGDRHAGRVGASLLNHAGLPRLIAHDEADYLRIARELASDLPALSALRDNLRGQLQGSALCDAPGFARAMGAAFDAMWRS